MKYYLAIDIGASSGRHILCHKNEDKLILEEVHRFKNGYKHMDGADCWDIERLFENVVEGIKKCCKLGKMPCSIGIDTWAVDYVLLDKGKKILGNPVAYRDKRTNGMDKIVESVIPFEELYRKTGIQKQGFNTIYQFMAQKINAPDEIKKAEYFLMIPDYLNFRLTGIISNEYTNASTTALVNADTRSWDMDIIDALGYPRHIFSELKLPGTVLGELSEEIREETGFNCQVILPATHDTGSAFLAVPVADEHSVFISSGTWSLLGIENEKPITTIESLKANFTNEGGYGYRFRYIKNIMGLWIIQSIKRELKDMYSFQELEEMAKKAKTSYIVDVSHKRFLAPDSMIDEIKNAVGAKGKEMDIPEIMQTVYKSLAMGYKNAVTELESLTNKKYKAINIIGGGSKDNYLNALTAKVTGLPVYAGPTEGTALGNLIVQMISADEVKSLSEARNIIRNTYKINTFKEA